ncbi:hypothetical protein NQ315_017213 [Exocentrus adspersus]|uniref:Uncharacterized protein n=1 Tax=Exocentrus adspersus TaxID=1586481 RepID=A0AAV8V984_9CUCU|nr:hypothetical protein NQ315_017213 [Exocentrus adspersus]
MSSKTLVFNVLVTLLLCLGLAAAKKPRAHYIKPCSKSAPDFDECCVAHGREALPFIVQGDKEYKIPSLNPLELSEVSLDSNGFKIAMKHLQAYGFDKNDLRKVKFDFDKKMADIRIFFDKLELLGDYEVGGKIILIPIEGTGKANFTIVDIDVNYTINYKLVDKEGEGYFAVDTSSADFTCSRTYIDIADLFGGNKELSDATNKALNDNWDQFIDALKPVVTQTIVQIGDAIINGFGSTVPFNDIFYD